MTRFLSILGCRKCGRCTGLCDALLRIDGSARIVHERCNLCMRCVIICQNKAVKLMDV